MALMLHDQPSMRQLVYGEPDPSSSQPKSYPSGWNAIDRSGLDWSCTIARSARLNNRHPGATMIPWHDIRAWNSGYWAGVLISPVHVLVCHHYYAEVPSQRNAMLFIGDRDHAVSAVRSVHANIAFDTTIIELAEPVTCVEPCNRIADCVLMPDRTPVWVQGPQMRSYQMLLTCAKMWDYGPGWHAAGMHLEPVPDDPLSHGMLTQAPGIFSGDSGSPVMVRMPDGRQAFVGMSWGGGIFRRFAGPSEGGISMFDRVRNVVMQRGYDIESVGWPGELPRPPQMDPDLNRDGKVDGKDLGILLNMFGRSDQGALITADINRDGTVDGADLGLLLAQWGNQREGAV